MSSRIVHARVSNRNIALCYQLLEAKMIPTNRLSISGAVVKVLDAFIRGQIAKGTLEDLTNTEAATIIREHSPAGALEVDEAELIFDAPRAEAPPKLDREALKTSINSALATVTTGGISPAAPKDLPELPAEPPPWEEYGSTPLEELLASSPMDYLLDQAREDKMLERAVCIIYRLLPVNEWGGAKALSLVKQLQQSFTEWQESRDEKSRKNI